MAEYKTINLLSKVLRQVSGVSVGPSHGWHKWQKWFAALGASGSWVATDASKAGSPCARAGIASATNKNNSRAKHVTDLHIIDLHVIDLMQKRSARWLFRFNLQHILSLATAPNFSRSTSG
jgi:hypothetical protein